MKAFVFLGTTDSVTECGCCGRSNLKGTVVLRNTETDQVVYFGSACGAKAVGWGVKEFNAGAKQAQSQREQAMKALHGAVMQPVRDEVAAEIEAANQAGIFGAPRMALLRVWNEWKAAAEKVAAAAVAHQYPAI